MLHHSGIHWGCFCANQHEKLWSQWLVNTLQLFVSRMSSFCQAFQASSLISSVKLVPYSWPSVVVLQVGSTVQTMIGYHCAHLVKPVTSKHHATKQDVIFLSSVSSVKLDVPYSWPSVVVLQVGSTVQTMIGYHCAHLVKPVSSKHHATKQDVIFLSSVSSVNLMYLILDQVW